MLTNKILDTVTCYIMVIQVYTPTTNAEKAEVEWFCEDLQTYNGSVLDLQVLELTPKKDELFITGDWKSRKSRNTWSNSQI